MNRAIILVTLLVSASAIADEFVVMTNGMTCWRNASGQLWGCSGGVQTGDTGFNNSKNGDRYEAIGAGRAVDTRNGQTFGVPQHDQDGR